MRILVLGGSGFIGSAVVAQLAAEGHEVVGVARSGPRQSGTAVSFVAFDIAQAVTPEQWLPLLDGVSVVVNCAGALQDSWRDSVEGVHAKGIAALFRACERAGVKRVVHVSAIGVNRETPSDFSRSKLVGDQALMASRLDWVILRPSVVIGRAAYGGSALLRGLAALPVFPILPDTGPLQLVHLDDLVDTIVFFLSPGAPARCVLDIAGPRVWLFADAVALFRRSLGWRPATPVKMPAWMATILFRAGDVAGLLGWRSPIRSTGQLELRRGAVGNPAEWTRITGIVPRDIEKWMRAEPASVQEHWFARLYFLKPAIFAVFSLYWIATGIISFTAGWRSGEALLVAGGLTGAVGDAVIALGAAADIAVGLAVLYRPSARYGLYAALAISVAYLLIGTVLVPSLWSDPLGPLLKVFPIVLLNLVAIAILPDR